MLSIFSSLLLQIWIQARHTKKKKTYQTQIAPWWAQDAATRIWKRCAPGFDLVLPIQPSGEPEHPQSFPVHYPFGLSSRLRNDQWPVDVWDGAGQAIGIFDC